MKDNQKGTLFSVAMAHMFILAVMIWVGAATSGAHYNPAVTIALFLTKQQHITDSLMYLIFQFLGSFAAGALIWAFCPDKYSKELDATSSPMLGQPGFNGEMPMPAFIFELVGTFILTFMVFALAVDKRAPKHVYGMGIGGALGVSVLAFGTVSGACLNPARWLGPATLSIGSRGSNFMGGLLIYLPAPIIGAILAALLYMFVLYKAPDETLVQKQPEFDE